MKRKFILGPLVVKYDGKTNGPYKNTIDFASWQDEVATFI